MGLAREDRADPGLTRHEETVFRGGGGAVGAGEGGPEYGVGEADFATLAAQEGDVGVVEVGGAVA